MAHASLPVAIVKNIQPLWGCICFLEAARRYLEPILSGEIGDFTVQQFLLHLKLLIS